MLRASRNNSDIYELEKIVLILQCMGGYNHFIGDKLPN